MVKVLAAGLCAALLSGCRYLEFRQKKRDMEQLTSDMALFQRLGQAVQIPKIFVQRLPQRQAAAVVRTELRWPGLHIDLELLAVQRYSEKTYLESYGHWKQLYDPAFKEHIAD